MRNFVCRVAVSLLLLLSWSRSPLEAQLRLTGQTPNGSYYTISAPPGWRAADGLVIWNHGFDLDPPAGPPDLGPLVLPLLAQGYAVAASSYSLSGWALFATRQDLRELLQVFRENFEEPEQILLIGASLGGIVTAQAVEDPALGKVVGALPICGAVAGSRIWDTSLDLRLLYDLVCDEVPGASIPGGATGLPGPVPPEIDRATVETAVDACTGVEQPAESRSTEQQERLDRLLTLTGIPESFFMTDMLYSTFALNDVLFDGDKMNGRQAVGNQKVDYGDMEVNALIERVAADPDARGDLLANYTPSGDVGDVKILSLHTDKDGLVLVENQSFYATIVAPRNLTVAVVREDEPSHCGFTVAELVAAWEMLRAWVAGAPQPSVADLQQVCESIAAGFIAPGPCRYDDAFVLPPVGDRLRPRDTCTGDDETLCLGDGRFRIRVQWQDFSGNTGAGRSRGLTPDTGLFWFFEPDNVEITVKVLDGRSINGRFWVFLASMTNVAFTVTVTDTQTGLERTYENASGEFASTGDTDAF